MAYAGEVRLSFQGLEGWDRMPASPRELLELVYELRLFKRKGNVGTPRKLGFYLQRLFEGVRFEGARVLDIGAGNGVFSFWMAANGARSVTSIEPELEGSAGGMWGTFDHIKRQMGLDNVTLERTTLQNFEGGGRSFDVILMHNSINHLDEGACLRLPDADAAETYRSLFRKCLRLTDRQGTVVIADCSRHNLFGTIGIRNPLAPSIDWRVHQTPRVWRELLEQSGFSVQRLSWTTLSALRYPGVWLLDNPLAAYFLFSHFSMVLRRGAGSYHSSEPAE